MFCTIITYPLILSLANKIPLPTLTNLSSLKYQKRKICTTYLEQLFPMSWLDVELRILLFGHRS